MRLYSLCRGYLSQAPHGKSLPELCFALLLSQPHADCILSGGFPGIRERGWGEKEQLTPHPGYEKEHGGFGFCPHGAYPLQLFFTGCFCSHIRTPDCKDLAEAELGLTHSPHLGSEAQRQANHLQATVLVCSMPPSIFGGHQSQN